MNQAGDIAWVNDYVGVPYVENGRRRDGWDCWGLVVAVYRDQLAIDLPDWQWHAPYGPMQRARAFAHAVAGLDVAPAVPLADPQPWAIGLVGGARPHHVGVVAGHGVLHAQRYGGTVWEPVGRFLANYPDVRWFRWPR